MTVTGTFPPKRAAVPCAVPALSAAFRMARGAHLRLPLERLSEALRVARGTLLERLVRLPIGRPPSTPLTTDHVHLSSTLAGASLALVATPGWHRSHSHPAIRSEAVGPGSPFLDRLQALRYRSPEEPPRFLGGHDADGALSAYPETPGKLQPTGEPSAAQL